LWQQAGVCLESKRGSNSRCHTSEQTFNDLPRPVAQIIGDAIGEIASTVRVLGNRHCFRYRPPVFATGKYTVNIGRDKPDGMRRSHLQST
jgi:hypothetical protein